LFLLGIFVLGIVDYHLHQRDTDHQEAGMNGIEQIGARQEEILGEMGQIQSLRRGTINEQYFRARLKGKKEAAVRGPYCVLSRREGEETVSKRLKSEVEVEQARRDVEAHTRFKGLCREFEHLTERLGKIIRTKGEDTQEKGLNLRSRSRRRWRRFLKQVYAESEFDMGSVESPHNLYCRGC
jgi:hypothetical protein